MNSTNLVIVESPAKAKTIEKILGKKFTVTSCFGHVRDLSKEKMGVDIKNNYKPNYIIPDDKKKVVSELRKLAKGKDVWLATDEDREGEAISWHLCKILKLKLEETKRIVFHEITKPAIEKAVKNPRHVNQDLVNAQQARRILDRLVGFTLSPVLIKKIPSSQFLSAGRVQSVAVRLIVEQEQRIRAFTPELFFKPRALFRASDVKNKKEVTFSAQGEKYKTIEEIQTLFDSYKDGLFIVKNISYKDGQKSPAAPFTTSTLQQEAVRKLGYSVSKTMLVAQRLYEKGLITYMRTDSVNLSGVATNALEKYIKSRYGDSYHKFRTFRSKNKNAQEAHEAIRPTDISHEKIPDNGQQTLYDLIRKRTLASQMANAKTKRTTIQLVRQQNEQASFQAQGEVITFPGFLEVYQEGTDNETGENEHNQFLPHLEEGQPTHAIKIEAKEKRTKAPARFDEASLVKKMEALGIGRPSTYAPTIATVLKRGYVEKKSSDGEQRTIKTIRLENGEITQGTESERFGVERNKLFPSDLGMLVNEFLEKNFEKIVDYTFTAQMEENFDKVANGQDNWSEMIDTFFTPFGEKVKVVEENAARISGERKLGDDPKTGKIVKVRMGRYGPMVQLGESDEEPKYSKLLPHQHMHSITFEEALELLQLPKEVGLLDEKPMVVKQGPFGPYIAYNSGFYSIPKEDDIFKVDESRAIEVIKAKQEADSKRLVKRFEDEHIEILNGRFGVYIKAKDGNYKIPKDLREKAGSFTLEEVKKIMEDPKNQPRKKRKK